MKKNIPNIITGNDDGKVVVEVKSFADIEKLKEHKEKKIPTRVVMHPKECIDPYHELVKAMTDLLGTPDQIAEVNFKEEAKN